MFRPKEIVSEETDEKFEEFENSLDKLSQDVNNLDVKVEEINFDRIFQLREPLDPVSSQVITRRVVMPINITLAGQTASSAQAYGVMFSADRSCFLESVSESHSTAAGAGTLQLVKCTSGEAIIAGDDILSTTFDFTALANQLQFRDWQSGFFQTAELLFFG